jgi:hypothetical protein
LSINDLLPEFIEHPLGTFRVMTDDARQPGDGAAPVRAAAVKTECSIDARTNEHQHCVS